jgi:hypothetical protein
MMRRLMKIARWALWTAAGLLTLLVVLHFILPPLLRTERFRAMISERLQTTDTDQARFGDIHLRLLPRPGLRIEQIHFDRPGHLALEAESVVLRIQILPLLRGRIFIDDVHVKAPNAIVHLPLEISTPEPDAGDEQRPVLRAAAALSEFPEGLHLVVTQGRLTFMRNGRPAARLHALALRIANEDGVVSTSGEGKSDWADDFQLEAEIDTSTLDGTARVEIMGAESALWESALRPEAPAPMIQAKVDLHLSVQSRAGNTFDATFDTRAPNVTLTRGKGSATVRQVLIQGAVQWTSERLQASLKKLQLGRPELNLSGSLEWQRPVGSRTERLRLRLQGHDSDVTGLREAIRSLTDSDDHPLWQVIRGGTLNTFTMESGADSFSSLWEVKNMHLAGTAADAQLFIPGVELHLSEVGGDWGFANGILSAQNAQARTGSTRGKNGSMELGFGGAPFLNLDIDISADLAQLPPILQRLIPQPGLQAELAQLRSVKGSAEGHLSISGPLGQVAVSATASDYSFTAEYDRLPFPLTVQGTGAIVTNENITLQKAGMRLADSTLSELSAKLAWSAPGSIDIRAAGGRIDWDQIYPWVARMAVSSQWFKEIQSIGGRMTLTDIRLAGALNDVAQWQFASSGTLAGMKVAHVRLPDRLNIIRGTFIADHENLAVSDLRILLQDGDIEADVKIEGYRSARPLTTLSGKGVLGDESTLWLHRVLDVPEKMYTRAPIGIPRFYAQWQEQSPTRVQGKFNLPGDLELEGEISVGRQFVEINELTLSDGRSNARMALRHDRSGRTWDLLYSGVLESALSAKLWRHNPAFAERIEGDLSLHIAVDQPAGSRFQGRLEASNVMWDASPWGNLIIRRLDMTSENDTLRIARLDLSLDEQWASIFGRVGADDQGISVNLTVLAQFLDAQRLERIFKPAPSPGAPETGYNPVLPEWRARINLLADRFVHGNMTWEPLHAELVLQKDRAEMLVSQTATCGVSMSGNALWTPEDLRIELIPQAKGQPLQVAAGCLAGGPSTERIEGTYDIGGRLTTHGKTPEALTHNLKGTIELEAVDGRILRTGSVGVFSNLLSYLQLNNLVTGDMPNLRGDDFWYDRIEIHLEFENGWAVIQEADVLSEGLNMVGEGRINLQNQRLDLTVLVSPLTTVDSIIRRIPIVGRILKGTLVAVPVGVRGTLSNPRVTPLAPKAVGTRLLGIMERILKAPFELIEPILQLREEEQEREE